MADGGDQLAGLVEGLDELDHPLVDPQVVGRLPARDQKRVVVVGFDLIDALLGLYRLLALLAFQLLARFHADDVHLVAFLLEPVVGDAELGVLEALTQNARDLHGRLLWRP